MNPKIKTYAYIGGSVLALGLAYYAYRKIKNKAEVNAAVKNVSTGTITKLGINIPSIAKQIGIDLGYAYPAWDPRRWSENDNAVKTSVLKVPKPLIKTLASEYYKIYKRNLQQDLQEKLDDYKDVEYLFT